MTYEIEPDGLDELINRVMIEQYEASQRGALSAWTIYNRPRDYRDGYIARRHETKGSVNIPTEAKLETGGTLTDLNLLRQIFAGAGLIPFDRHPDDDLAIVEVWM